MKVNESKNTNFIPKESMRFGGVAAEKNFHVQSSKNFRVSLKQWKMFQAVIDYDGFTGAASHLHISQSAISYTLAKLQEQLGVTLLKIEGRKAQLTEEGKILLSRSRILTRNAIELETLAESLRQGWGPEIRIMIDQNFPAHLLMLALHRLSPGALPINLSVEEATTDQIENALLDHATDLAIGTQVPNGFVGNELIEIEHVAIAHPDHPLFALNREITADDLENEMQIVISGTNDHLNGNQNCRSNRCSRIWNVRSFDTAIGALRHCLGYARLPKYRVQRWLDQDQVRVLPLCNGSSYKTHLHLIYGRSINFDSGTKMFADILSGISAVDFIEPYPYIS